MALLLMDGFDAGDATLKWTGGGSAGSYATTRFSTGRAASLTNVNMYRTFAAASQIYVGLAMSINLVDAVVRAYLSLYGDNGSTQHLTIGYTNSSIIVYRGGIGGTILGTYSSSFIANAWYTLEVSATIADTGGTCVVRFNGATVINYTGDTKNAGTNTTIDAVLIGSNGGYTAYFDDIYVCDGTGPAPYNTFLGDVRIYALSPSGAGSSTQFTPSTGANYTTVDELPYSATDYVTSSTVGQRDTYVLTDLPATVGTVYAVQNNVIAKRADATFVSLKPALKSGASVYYGTTVSLGVSDSVLQDLRTTDPSTAVSWTASGVNALESGFEVA